MNVRLLLLTASFVVGPRFGVGRRSERAPDPGILESLVAAAGGMLATAAEGVAAEANKDAGVDYAQFGG